MRKTRRGGGIFNTIKGIFTRKKKIPNNANKYASTFTNPYNPSNNREHLLYPHLNGEAQPSYNPTIIKPSNYEPIGLSPSVLKRENATTANVSGLNSECNKLKGMTKDRLREYVMKNHESSESFNDSFNRLSVFLYYKMNNMELNDNTINNAHRKPNDTMPLQLKPEQFEELRNEILKKKGLSMEEISMSLFNTELGAIDNQIQRWEKSNELIYYGNKCVIAFTSAGDLGRAIALFQLNDIDRTNTINASRFMCNPSDNNCVVTFPSLDAISSDMMKLYMWICIPARGNSITANLNDITKIRIINDDFKNARMLAINPKLGLIIQNKYPALWDQSYWSYRNKNSRNLDTFGRVTILTLQKYAAIRRFNETDDSDWCSQVYITSPKNAYMAYELKNIQDPEALAELIENQKWATGREARYTTLESLNNLLPTPRGFAPILPWKILDSRNKNTQKMHKRHSNVLRKLAYSKSQVNGTIRKRVTSPDIRIALKQANAWNTVERIKHKKQYVTRPELLQYEKNYEKHFEPVPGPNPRDPRPAGPRPSYQTMNNISREANRLGPNRQMLIHGKYFNLNQNDNLNEIISGLRK
jgi:hypothetical protein